MDVETFQALLRQQTLELTRLHGEYLTIWRDKTKTRWYQFAIRRDLKLRAARIVVRVREIEIERDRAYVDAMNDLELQERFAEIIEQNGWKL